MLPFRELNRQEPEKWLSDHTAALKRLMKANDGRAMTAEILKAKKNNKDVKLLFGARATLQQIISKSKNILSKERKANKRKANESLDEPNVKQPRKQYRNKGVSQKGRRRTKWTADEDKAVRKIHGHVTYNNASWNTANHLAWKKENKDKEMKKSFKLLSNGTLNGKGIHRSPDAIVTKFNKFKLMGFNNDNTGEESTDE